MDDVSAIGRGKRSSRLRGSQSTAVATLVTVAAIAVIGSAPRPGAPRGHASPVASTTRLSRWSPGHPGTVLLHLNGGPLNIATEARRRRAIILNAWDWRLVGALKTVNPSLLVLVYKDLSSTRSYACRSGADDRELPTGVGYCVADREHPEWFLLDGKRRRMEWAGFPGHWMMDVGNPWYQHRWLSEVKADTLGRGWDGVFLDNALTRSGSYGMSPLAYRGDVAIQAATRSMLVAVCGGLRSAGLITLANIPDSRLFAGLWRDWAGIADAAYEEHFVDWSPAPGSGYEWDWGPGGWATQVDEISTSAAIGHWSVVRAEEVPGDPAGFLYSLASYLLANDGRQLFIDLFDDPTWHPEYDYDLGAPAGTGFRATDGVYRRDFSAGSVIVNPSLSPVRLALDGPYVDPGGACVRLVTLGATRATILRRVPIQGDRRSVGATGLEPATSCSQSRRSTD